MTYTEAADIIACYEINGCGYCHQGGNEIEEAFKIAIEVLNDMDFVNTQIVRLESKVQKIHSDNKKLE